MSPVIHSGGLEFNFNQNLLNEELPDKQLVFVIPDDIYLLFMVIKDFDERCAWYMLDKPMKMFRVTSFWCFYNRYLNDAEAGRVVIYEKYRQKSGVLYGGR